MNGVINSWQRGRVVGLAMVLFTGLFAVAAVVNAARKTPAQGSARGPAPTSYPTPTPWPVDDVAVQVDEVGGEPARWAFDLILADGTPVGSGTAESRYPRGLVFTLRPDAALGAPSDVTLRLRYATGLEARQSAAFDAATGTWTAHVWPTGDGHPAWTPVMVAWRFTAGGAVRETEPQPVVYADPTRRWLRLTTPYMTVYWYGLGDDQPERFARVMARDLTRTHGHRRDGFGAEPGYVPVGVIYGDAAGLAETVGSGAVNRGGVVYGRGVSALAAPDGVALEQQIAWMSFKTVHELVHLWQQAIIGGTLGPVWWYEGQAQWFASTPWDYDARLRALATQQPLPSLTGPVSADTLQADGLPDLAYDMGASFVNWLVGAYGVEQHAAIVAAMVQGVPFEAALEAALGQSLFELQNAWRGALGLPPFSLADLDPASALMPYADPAIAVGDRVTLPAAPPFVPLNEQPGARSLAQGSCFAAMDVTVLAIGALDGVPYYQIDCMGMVGWVKRTALLGEE